MVSLTFKYDDVYDKSYIMRRYMIDNIHSYIFSKYKIERRKINGTKKIC